MNKRAVCVISGGLDSTVAAAKAQALGYDLYFLFVNYGQKTLKREQACVKKLEKHFNPKKAFYISLPWLKEFGGSALFDLSISLNERNFRLEYVPFRNSILFSAATALAEAVSADAIFVGSSGGDHICPDNSPAFLDAFQAVIKQGTMLKKGIRVVAPLRNTDKVGAVRLGKKLSVPFELTWSCHNNTERACGHCSNCRSRLEAFNKNQMKDPLEYENIQ